MKCFYSSALLHHHPETARKRKGDSAAMATWDRRAEKWISAILSQVWLHEAKDLSKVQANPCSNVQHPWENMRKGPSLTARGKSYLCHFAEDAKQPTDIQYIWTRNNFLQEQTCEKSRLLSHNHSVCLRKSFHGPSQAFLFPTWLNFVGKQPSWICYLRLSWKETSPFSQFHTIQRFLIKMENDPAQLFNTSGSHSLRSTDACCECRLNTSHCDPTSPLASESKTAIPIWQIRTPQTRRAKKSA